MGDATRKGWAMRNESITPDTFGRRIYVEWDPAAAWRRWQKRIDLAQRGLDHTQLSRGLRLFNYCFCES